MEDGGIKTEMTENQNQEFPTSETEHKIIKIEESTDRNPDIIPNVKLENPETDQPMSKRQIKKLEKLRKFQENKLKMRKAEKDKRKLKRKLCLEQGIELVKTGPSRKALKRNKIAQNPADIQVAIDLSFDELMIDKDLGSCASQLLRVYTANRRASRPIPVHFTGLNEKGKLYEKLERNEGWKNWDVIPHKEGFMELFDKDKIIYLTSESETVLDTLEAGAVYVIGGLVDHNHHKSLTHDLAGKSGVRTARLPLSEHLIIKTRTVLTINQVFDIILGVSEGKAWKEVLLEALPLRKGIKAKEDQESAVEEAASQEAKEICETSVNVCNSDDSLSN